MSKNWKDFILRSFISIMGVVLLSFGAALSESMNMGLDPFTALNRGASSFLGISLGNYQLVLNFIILSLVFFLKRSLIGWGTIYNMVLVGYLVNIFKNLFDNFLDADSISLAIRLLITVVAILFFTFGASLYMDTELGHSPYDAIAPVITDRTGWSYTPVRLGQDLLVVLGAYLLSGPVGISTIITGFFASPLITFFSKNVSKPIIEKI